MIDWNKHLHRINGSYLNTPHGLSFEGYRVRQILTRICVSSECFGEAIYFVDKKQPVRFTRAFRFASNKIWRVNLRVFVSSKYLLRPNGRKIVKQINSSSAQGLQFENIECSKYQLIFVTAEQVFSRSFLFWLKTTTTTKTAHRFTHRLYVCLFLSKDSASGF